FTIYSCCRIPHTHFTAITNSCIFFSHPPTSWIYALSLHDALPIWRRGHVPLGLARGHPCLLHGGVRRLDRRSRRLLRGCGAEPLDRKSTRLNSSHVSISYAVFCLKK